MPIRLLSWLAPALLCLVAAVQMTVSSRTFLSPWKLGGFGMYSGVDSIAARWIRPVLVTNRGELPLSFDRLLESRPDLADASRAVRSWPELSRLARLGDSLLNDSGVWADCTPLPIAAGGRVAGPFVQPLAPERLRALGCRPLAVAALRLEIWRYRYASEGRSVASEKILEAGALPR